MTAPVTPSAVPSDMRVQFVLPKDVSLDSAPEPLDPRVPLRLVPTARWAVIRYSGSGSQAHDEEHLTLLQRTLAEPAWAVKASRCRPATTRR